MDKLGNLVISFREMLLLEGNIWNYEGKSIIQMDISVFFFQTFLNICKDLTFWHNWLLTILHFFSSLLFCLGHKPHIHILLRIPHKIFIAYIASARMIIKLIVNKLWIDSTIPNKYTKYKDHDKCTLTSAPSTHPYRRHTIIPKAHGHILKPLTHPTLLYITPPQTRS